MQTTTRRARPMAQEERKAMIVDAVIPLLLEYGHTITTRQIAQAAGVAEGTVFRAFGDKESLVTAAVEKYFDPQPMRAELARIPQHDPLEDKIKAAIAILQARFGGVFAMMSALGQSERPRFVRNASQRAYSDIVGELLGPESARLNLPVERVASVLRLVAFATSIPQFSESVGFDLDELTGIVMYGIVGEGRDLTSPSPTPTRPQKDPQC